MATNPMQFRRNQNLNEDQLAGPFGRGRRMFNQIAPSAQTGAATQGAQSAYQPVAQGQGLVASDLSLGKGGRVNIDPYTGEEIKQKDRMKPLNYLSQQYATGPSIDKAMNFQFDIPDSGVQNLLPQLSSAGQNLLGQSQGAMQSGGQLTNNAGQALMNNIGQTGAQAGMAGQDRAQALGQLQSLQQKALAPNIDPRTRMQLQGMADQERANILTRFQEGGDIADLYSRQNSSDTANLAAKGVLDSQTAANVIGRRQADLGALGANLLAQADQRENQNILDERNRITNASTAFGGLQGGQATSSGGLLSNLFGTQGQSAAQLGNIGNAQQGIGAQLAQLGLSGLNSAGQLGLADQDQQGNLQQAQLSTNLMGNQLGLQNIQSLLNQRLGRQATRQGMDLQQQLADAALNPEGTPWWKTALFGPFA